MKKKDKKPFVESLAEELKSASSVVLVDFAGLNVKGQQELKNRLKKVNASLKVVKNTLFKLAGKKAKSPDDALTDTVLAGPTALVITEEDPIAPLQVVAKFAKENELPNLKVGIVEGVFQDKENLEKLATLPGKDALYAQVVGAVASPMYALMGTLESNLQKLIHVLTEASKKSE